MEFFETSNIHLYIAIFLSIINGGLLCFLSSKFLQVYQQAGYHIKGYNAWMRGTRYKYLSRLFILSLLSISCALVTNALFDVYHSEAIYSYLGLIFYFYFSFSFIMNLIKEPNKTPLVKTKRIGRTIAIMFILYAALTFCLIALSTEFFKLLRFGVITITPILVPFVVILAFWILTPFELLVNHYYISKAKRKLKKLPNLIRIGITGSYAKTTNKFILQQMLSQKYKTIASPHSFNTPLGLTRVILQQIDEDDEIFIAEMGAKRRGEIDELCKLVGPNHGLITGIGNQHLETFKTIEAISQTKFELAKSISNGYVVFNGDSKPNLELYEKYENPNKLISYGNDERGFAYCTDIEANKNGLKFKLVIDGKSVNCQTKLLGKFNLQNIALCSSLAYKLGVSLKQIKKAIKDLKPVAHRMELINGENCLIIDDSFNASVEGCDAALETLSLFTDMKKVVITPGIVEMGKYETEVNKNLGVKIAKVCDYAIIVNEVNAQALKSGLEEGGFKEENLFIVDNLEDAKKSFASLQLENCVVLFENDLPDLFV